MHMTNINEDLGRWFREKWVDISKKDKDGKHPPCGREAASKKHGAYPKCRPSKQVSSDTPETSGEMSKDEKEAAVRQKRRVEKKRRKDKKPHMASHKDIKEQTYTPSKEFKGQVLDAIKAKPKGISRKDLMKQMKERYKFVPGIAFEKLLDAALEWWEEGAEIVNMGGMYKVTDSVNEETENVPTNPELWSKAKAMAKAKFRVYPSAYANGWAVKWYNDHGGGWKKESTKESVEIEEATLVTVRVKIANKAAWKKIEPLIASIDSWKESDWNGDKGTGAFMFDASKHTQSDRKKVAEFIKNTKGIEFDHSIEEATGTQMYALVVNGKIVAKGSAKAMRKAAKAHGGPSREKGVFVGNSPSSKVGDKWNESTDAFQGKRFSEFVAEAGTWRKSGSEFDKETDAYAWLKSKGYKFLTTDDDGNSIYAKGRSRAYIASDSSSGWQVMVKEEFVAEVADKESMPCNKPRPSTRPGKKRMVKACQDGQEKIVHYGADGYGHNYSAKARASFRARHNCDQAKDKLSAQYWACKDLWAGKGGSTKGCPGGKDDPDCKY